MYKTQCCISAPRDEATTHIWANRLCTASEFKGHKDRHIYRSALETSVSRIGTQVSLQNIRYAYKATGHSTWLVRDHALGKCNAERHDGLGVRRKAGQRDVLCEGRRKIGGMRERTCLLLLRSSRGRAHNLKGSKRGSRKNTIGNTQGQPNKSIELGHFLEQFGNIVNFNTTLRKELSRVGAEVLQPEEAIQLAKKGSSESTWWKHGVWAQQNMARHQSSASESLRTLGTQPTQIGS